MRGFGMFSVLLLVVGCGSQSAPPASPPPAAPVAPAAKPYATLAEVMRAIPFQASNTIFDTQKVDPGAPVKETGTVDTGSATAAFGNMYGGWQRVELAAMALTETANLLSIPGRLCENGRPVPLDREDFRKAIQGLADAGQAAYKAAKSKNLDAMVDVSGQIADACGVCHEVYRDKADLKDRCTP